MTKPKNPIAIAAIILRIKILRLKIPKKDKIPIFIKKKLKTMPKITPKDFLCFFNFAEDKTAGKNGKIYGVRMVRKPERKENKIRKIILIYCITSTEGFLSTKTKSKEDYYCALIRPVNVDFASIASTMFLGTIS